MRFRREPNPNRNHPAYCPYCASESLFPDEEGDFAWRCSACLRVFSVMFHGQDNAPVVASAAPSAAQALQDSLRRHGHSTRPQS